MVPIQEEELKKIIPTDGPSISEVKSYLEKYNDEYIVIKCGGSVLVEQNLFDHFIDNISILNKLGFIPIIVMVVVKEFQTNYLSQVLKASF